MMKICYVITKADEIGGAQVHVRDLCFKLKQDGHQPYIIVGEKGALVTQLEHENIPVIIMKNLVREISPLKDFLALFELRKIIKQTKPDLVTLHSSKAGIIGRLSLLGTGVPVIFTAHGWSFAEGISQRKRQFYILIEKVCAKFCKTIITVSLQDKNLAIKENVAPAEKQVVIHNGIFELINRTKKPCNTTCNIISIARFSEQKDHFTLIYALAECKDIDWHLSLVGKGCTLNSIKSLVKELGLGERITFLGERDDIAELLFQADIFTLISNWEGFPISILEAMRAGLPVIASDVGGVNEAVIDGENGFLVERKNINQLAQKFRLLITDKQLRHSLGEKGQEKFITNFSFDSMYEKTLNEYLAVCEKV